MTFHRTFRSSPQQVKSASLRVLAICLCGSMLLFSGCTRILLTALYPTSVIPMPYTSAALQDYALFDGELYALVTIDRGTGTAGLMGHGGHSKSHNVTVGIIKLNLNDPEHVLVAADRIRDKSSIRGFQLHLSATNAFVFVDSNTSDLVKITCPPIPVRGVSPKIDAVRSHSKLFKVLANHRFMYANLGEEIIIDLSEMRVLDTPETRKMIEVVVDWRSRFRYFDFVMSDDMKLGALSSFWIPQVWIYNLPNPQIYKSDHPANIYVELFAVASLGGRPTWLERDSIESTSPNPLAQPPQPYVHPEPNFVLYQEGIGKISERQRTPDEYLDPAYDPDMCRIITLSIPQSDITVPFTVNIWHPFQNRTEQKPISISAVLKELKKIK
jgi:hypothetical protein